MGAGILPTTIHKNKLYFLFGKENKYEKSAPGFADFGGGTDNSETFMETAIREAGEEFTGFLGDNKHVKTLLNQYGTYNIDYHPLNTNHSIYRMHIFPFHYDESLVYYYNNNQKFLQSHLEPKVIQNSKIFEKEEIRWFCIDDLDKNRNLFRHYFRNIIDIILREKDNIKKFILQKKISKKSANKGKTRRRLK